MTHLRPAKPCSRAVVALTAVRYISIAFALAALVGFLLRASAVCGGLQDFGRPTRQRWSTRWLDDRRIVVFRLIDPRGDRPHPHGCGRERSHQIAGVGLVAQPAGIIARRQDQRHAIVDFGHQLVCVRRDHRECANPLSRSRFFPVLPQPANAERPAVLHGDGIGLLGFLALDRLPLEEAVDGDDTAPPAIGIPEGRQVAHGLAFSIDRPSPALRVLAPIRDKAPAQGLEGDLAGLMITPNHQQVLAWRGVPPRRIIVHAAVTHVHAVDNGITYGPTALDDSPAHDRYVVRSRRSTILQPASMVPPGRPLEQNGLRATGDSAAMKHPSANQPQEVLAGLVERVTYHNAENGFCVLRAKARGYRDVVTVVGHAAAIAAGEWITASGEWVNDRTHGQQFKARFLHTSPPTSADGIEKYLSSGMIRGIGPAYARKLLRAFGEKVFDVIEAAPDRLREVDGIGPVRAASILAAWAEQKAVREIMVFLHSHGVGTARAVRIYKTYGPDAIQVMTENPYRLARDIRGIGFKTADAIAMKLGIEKTAMVRVRAGISYALTEAMDEGHCGLPTEELIPLAEKLLEVPQELIRFGLDPIRDVQVLCPMNRGGVGARSLNIELQAALNPAGERKVERFGWTFAPGDKVMQIENDYDKEVYNGDIGFVADVEPEEGKLSASFDGRSVTYGFGELDALVPAYAASIHKSQGSEYPAVVIPVMTQHYAMLQRNLLYTGVTRGKRLVVLVGQKKAVAIAVRNVLGRRRWSKLQEWLRPSPSYSRSIGMVG